MIEAELFDGTVLEFPEGTSPDVIQNVVRQQTAQRRAATPEGTSGTPAPTPAPAAPAGRSMMDAIFGAGAQAIRGAREGVSTVLGLPVDAMNNAPRLLNLLPGVDGVGPMSKRPFLGSDSIDAALGGFGAIPEPPAPQGMGERMARRVGKELGGAAVPAAGALGAAARVGVQGAREMSALPRMFVEPAAVAPSRFVGKETAMATGAGVGAGTANEAVDPSTTTGQVADLIGAIFGAGATGIGSATLRGARDLAAAGTGNTKFASGVVRDRVADVLTQNSEIMGRQVDPNDLSKPLDTQVLVDAITRPARVEQAIPGFRASTAERAGDQGLASLEAARAKNNVGSYNQRADANAAAVDSAMGALAPTEPPSVFRGALDAERGRQLGASEQALTQAQAQFDEALRNLEPVNANPEARGATIRGGLENAERAAREVESAAYAGVSGQVDPAGLAQAFEATTANVPAAYQGLVNPVADALAVPGAATQPLDIQEIIAIRSRLTTAQRNATRGPQPDSNQARILGQYIDALDGYLGQSGVSPDIQARLESARAISRDVNERFNRPNDPIAAVLSRREGRPDVPDSAVGSQFVQPDTRQASNIDRALAETDLTSRGAETFGALQDEARANALRFGRENPERLGRFAQDYSRATERLGVREDITAAAGAGRQAQTAAQADEALRRELGTPGDERGTGPVGKYLRYSDANSERAMKEVMAAPDPAKAADDLLTFAGNDPKALEGARAAFWQNLDSASRSKNAATETAGGTMPVIGRNLVKFLDDPRHAAVAERLYRDNPQHLANLREIGSALREVSVGRRAANAANPSGTALMARGDGVTMAEVGSKAYQAQIGRTSPAFVLTYLAGKVARVAVGKQRQQAFELLLDSAVQNPEIAAAVLRENNPANRAALARSAKGWLGNQASTLINLMSDDEDDVKDAVMRKEPGDGR